jgi:hypothetical protein
MNLWTEFETFLSGQTNHPHHPTWQAVIVARRTADLKALIEFLRGKFTAKKVQLRVVGELGSFYFGQKWTIPA